MVNIAQLLNLPALEGELAAFEDALRTSVVTTDPFLTDVAGHLIQAGGKRLRPALVMASALAGGAEVTGDVGEGGISVELVHLGSLYHDDVLDEATDRRGVESVNARWGNLVAILSGDFLLARASEIAASLGTEVAGLLAATIARLCVGQVSELKTAFQIGFLIFIPFLVIDIVVSSSLMSMGMMMLPPVMISLPCKLLLFVLGDGWGLVITALVQSYQ